MRYMAVPVKFDGHALCLRQPILAVETAATCAEHQGVPVGAPRPSACASMSRGRCCRGGIREGRGC